MTRTINSSLIDRSRELRQDQTKAEEVLWYELRDKKLGYKFRRQFPTGHFILDFFCFELKLVIELDGPIHDEQKSYDERREHWLKEQGYYVLRFKNDEVLFERERVMEKIRTICEELSNNTSPRAPLLGGEGSI